MVPFQVTLSDPLPKFQGHGIIFRPIDALNILHGQLTRDLFVIAKFLFLVRPHAFFSTFDVLAYVIKMTVVMLDR